MFGGPIKAVADVGGAALDGAKAANGMIKDATGVDVGEVAKDAATNALMAPVNNIKNAVSLGSKAVGGAADIAGDLTGIDTSAISDAAK